MAAIESTETQKPAIPRDTSYWRNVFRRLLRDKTTVLMTSVLLTIVLFAIFAPYVTFNDPFEGDVFQRLKPIGTSSHWLGTDETGRDMWSRLVYGGRYSLLSGILPVAIALLVGGALGIVAGYFGGWVNTAIMRTMDVFYAFPSILMAVAICGVFGASLQNSIISLAIVFVPPITRIAESVTVQVREFGFVDAARASGAGSFKIIIEDILSNVAAPIRVYASSLVGLSMILASGLSFLGLGISPPIQEWGLMLNSLRSAIYINPYITLLPGVMIFITSMCFNLMSDGLRSAMDIRF